jgi:uncharacterized protein (TIGR02147 family)
MDIYTSTDYRKILNDRLYGDEKIWGQVNKLARKLNCHPSFISQVAREQSHFSQEQAVAFCEFFKMTDEETDYFIDLVSFCRASTKPSRDFFAARLTRHREKRRDLSEKYRGEVRILNAQEESMYYSSWVPAAIHMLLQTSGDHTIKTIATRLSIDPSTCEQMLTDMKRMGIVEQKGIKYICLEDSVHLAKGSEAAQRGHLNWRSRTVQELLCSRSKEPFHYSAVFTIAEEDAEAIQDLVRQQLEKVRTKIVSSKSEAVYVHCIDFYKLLTNPQ